jgi:RNA polymerase sigma factor (sigma-70 family)
VASVDDPLAYARRSLVNASANRWRWRARRREVPLTDSHDVVVADAGPRHDQRDELIRAIAMLPARQRAVVVLRFLEDLTEAQTAVALGCSVGTVKSQTSRALARLRELVGTTDEVPALQRTEPRSA